MRTLDITVRLQLLEISKEMANEYFNLQM